MRPLGDALADTVASQLKAYRRNEDQLFLLRLSVEAVRQRFLAAAKAAVVNLTVSLAKALSDTGVTSNTISPGLIHTPNVERVLRERAWRSG